MKTFFLLCALLCPLLSFGSEEISYGRTWLGMFQRKALTERTSVLGELQLRYLNDSINLQQILVRPGFLYRLDGKNEVGLLYGYVQTGALKEHRPTLQWLSNLGQGVSARTRLELRKWEEKETLSVRLRPMLRIEYPLESKRSLVLWDEPFLNLSHDGESGQRIFERNRVFLGMRFPFEHAHVEAGYLNQVTPRTQRTVVEHILVVSLFI